MRQVRCIGTEHAMDKRLDWVPINIFELKENLTDSTVRNTGETGDINAPYPIQLVFDKRGICLKHQ